MLRMNPLASAKKAEWYYAKSDGGYYLQPGDARQEWVGKGAKLLGLAGAPEPEQFKRLLNGLDPRTGGQLTALLVDDRVAGCDVNVHCPKGVSSAINGGDARLVEAFWAAAHEAVADLERSATTRVRKGGKDADRITGNLVGFAVSHHEGRPTKEDGMPDWHEHIHIVLFNLTKDPVENQWKAVKFRALLDRKKLFDRCFNLRFSSKAAALGYEVETLYKPDGKGGRAYKGWDIKANPGFEKEWASLNGKNSRRTKEVEERAEKIVAAMKERDPDAPDRLSAVAKDKLGATSRLGKRTDKTLDDYREYWDSRITPEERRARAYIIGRAMQGKNPKPEKLAAQAMEYAIAHHFERSSVVEFRDLAVTAMEKSMGAARVEDFEPEAWRKHGLLFAGSKVSTQAVLDQEQRIIGFARAGKGTCRPLAADVQVGLEKLSDEQKAAVRHVWDSTDRVMLIRGSPGSGKTTMMTPALARLGVPAVLLAPSSDASRGQLRKEGFSEANTVASFLCGDAKMQEKARGGIIWVDESGLLAINDLDRLCTLAKELDARIVLQGDPSQHKAVQRHGNMLTVLEDYAGLPVAKLTKIQRQKGEYARIVEAVRDGKMKKGAALLGKLGWIVEGGNSHDALVAAYAKAIEEKKPSGEKKTVLVVNPTHKDGDALSQALRAVRKAKGLITGDEKTFPQLTALGWTKAQQGDPSQYSGGEVIQFFRNSGKFRAGDRVKASELLPELANVKPEHFAVYGEGEVNFAVGDTVRITANGRDAAGEHRLDNGRIDEIRGFTPSGDIVLANGWVVAKDYAHIKHGLVQTSPATQSKTEDVVLTAMNKASLGAMGAEQALVTISRGRERGMIFTDLSREELLEAIARGDNRMSATELFHRKPEAAQAAKMPERMRAFMEKVRTVYRQWQEKAAHMASVALTPREPVYER